MGRSIYPIEIDASTLDGLDSLDFEESNNKGQINGYAPLDALQTIPLIHIPDIPVDGGTF
jgi:hypothetical protein